jgi:hypothetical protein
MAASLDDILTTQKNGVIAINNLGGYILSLFGWYKGTSIPRTAATTSVSTIYTVPSTSNFTLTDIEICNTTSAQQTFSIYLVPSGGTASASNALFYSALILGNTTVQWAGSQYLASGGTIQASASATTVTFMINGGNG